MLDPYDWEERAAIYEYDAGMTREQAEQKATEDQHKAWQSEH